MRTSVCTHAGNRLPYGINAVVVAEATIISATSEPQVLASSAGAHGVEPTGTKVNDADTAAFVTRREREAQQRVDPGRSD